MKPLLPFPVILACLAAHLGCAQQTSDSAEEPPVPSADAADSGTSTTDDPNRFKVKFETSTGDFVVAVAPNWAPKGAARFRELVETGFYNGCRFFRVVPGFVVQWGISGDPDVQAKWREATIEDDPVVVSNTRGRITFAMSGPDSRTTQVFISYGDNSQLDEQGFAPFGEVIDGMDVVGSINADSGEAPQQLNIQLEGNEYLNSKFPNLDYIKKATIIDSESAESKPHAPRDAVPDRAGGNATPDAAAA